MLKPYKIEALQAAARKAMIDSIFRPDLENADKYEIIQIKERIDALVERLSQKEISA